MVIREIVSYSVKVAGFWNKRRTLAIKSSLFTYINKISKHLPKVFVMITKIFK
jgi:hypothetical protein